MHGTGAPVALTAFGLSVTAPAAILYVTGVVLLQRRGDRWSPARALSFLVGLAAVAVVTVGPLGAQSMMSFSAHMVQHMTLNMVAPILLALGAPLTLAFRTTCGSTHRALVASTRSRLARAVTTPMVVATVYTASLFVLYFTPLFSVLMADMWGHLLMQVHFLVSGYLFFWLLLGADPGPRPSHPQRIPVVVVMVLGHTVFAFALVFARSPAGGGYFAQLGGATSEELLRDQALAGGIAWGLGEISSAIVIAILLVQWFARSARHDSAERRRRTRRMMES